MNEEGYCVSVAAVRSVPSRLHTSSSASPPREEKWEKVKGFLLFFALATHMHAQCTSFAFSYSKTPCSKVLCTHLSLLRPSFLIFFYLSCRQRLTFLCRRQKKKKTQQLLPFEFCIAMPSWGNQLLQRDARRRKRKQTRKSQTALHLSRLLGLATEGKKMQQTAE